MSDKSSIEWTQADDGTLGATWNPVTGCTKISDGCTHCYAETFAERWRGTPGHHFEQGFDVTLRPERLGQPLRWKRPRRIFVNSMSDLFHEAVPAEFIAQVFATMAGSPQHTFQLLTKRHGRMRALLRSKRFAQDVNVAYVTLPSDVPAARGYQWPLPNVWLGVSVEDQKWAGIRVPVLLDTPAAVRFVSAEPLLGPVDLTYCAGVDALRKDWAGAPHPLLDWVIAGGESGPGARPCNLAWLRSLVYQCQQDEVPVFVKQLGRTLGLELGAGPKGGDWERWPEDLQVREFPRAAEAVPA